MPEGKALASIPVPIHLQRPYLRPPEQAAFLRAANTTFATNPCSYCKDHPPKPQHFLDGAVLGGFRVSARRVQLDGGDGGFYVPDELESIAMMTYSSGREHAVFAMVKAALQNGGHCRRRGGARRIVLDIGANEGFFGLLAASWGCLTYLFEPQPSCQAALYSALLLNSFGTDVARVVPRPVSAEPFEMLVSPSVPCVGQFPRNPQSYDERKHPLILQRRRDRRLVGSVNASDVLPAGPLLLAKVDVDGGELGVLESLLPLMRRRLLHNVVVEITPGWWPGGEPKYGCTGERGCVSAARAARIGRAVDEAGYAVMPIPVHGWPAACDPEGIGQRSAALRKLGRDRLFARAGFAPATGSRCAFSDFLNRTMDQMLYDVWTQDVWLALQGARPFL